MIGDVLVVVALGSFLVAWTLGDPGARARAGAAFRRMWEVTCDDPHSRS